MSEDIYKKLSNIPSDNILLSELMKVLETNYDKYKNLISFIVSEKFLTLTVIGSIFTFQFVSSLKIFIIDPLLEYILVDDNFKDMKIILRDGMEQTKPDQKKIYLDFGAFFKEFIKWLFVMIIIYFCAVYTRFPDEPLGNITGAAVL